MTSIKTLLLLALPASGKSEVRRYMATLDPQMCQDKFGLGTTVQLDDYPYVHMMHRIDDELKLAGGHYVWFDGPREPFSDPICWSVLIELLNEDYDDLIHKRVHSPTSAAEHLFERYDAARVRAGGEPVLSPFPESVRKAAAQALEAEAQKMLEEKHAEYPDTLEGKTVVIEAARGGPEGASMPLAEHRGYVHSLARFSDDVLDGAAILYIWVTPEESRRKNTERTDPNDPGSILHHGVPMCVMLGEYGCDDIEYLMGLSDRPDTIRVETRGKVFYLPIGRFDNRIDKTTFLRKDEADWTESEVAAVDEQVRAALTAIAGALRS